MPNWCRNSIMIPQTHKKAFMRKFTRKQRVRNYLSQDGSKWELHPASAYMSYDRIMPMPKRLPDAQVGRWIDDNWGGRLSAYDVDFAIHNDCEHSGMFEIIFDTAWVPAGEKLVEEIARRLHCNVEHVFLEECQDSYGIREFIFEDGDNHDEPELFFMQEAEDNEDTFETIVTRFHGYSDYADELMERYRNGEIQ